MFAVKSLDNSNDYFRVSTSSVEWWTAYLTEGGWYIVNKHGREIKSDGRRGKQIVSAVENERKMTAVRRCLG